MNSSDVEIAIIAPRGVSNLFLTVRSKQTYRNCTLVEYTITRLLGCLIPFFAKNTCNRLCPLQQRGQNLAQTRIIRQKAWA